MVGTRSKKCAHEDCNKQACVVWRGGKQEARVLRRTCHGRDDRHPQQGERAPRLHEACVVWRRRNPEAREFCAGHAKEGMVSAAGTAERSGWERPHGDVASSTPPPRPRIHATPQTHDGGIRSRLTVSDLAAKRHKNYLRFPPADGKRWWKRVRPERQHQQPRWPITRHHVICRGGTQAAETDPAFVAGSRSPSSEDSSTEPWRSPHHYCQGGGRRAVIQRCGRRQLGRAGGWRRTPSWRR